MKQFRSFVPYRKRPFCFFDIETTGLKPGYHEITEIGFRHTEKGGLCLQIAPQYMERAEPEALQKSGYNTADWAEARPFKDNAAKIAEFLEDATIVGHNAAGFDVPFLKAEYESAGLDHDHLFRDVVDTQALARVHLVPMGLNLVRMEACMKFMGVEYVGAHNAYEDAVFAEKLYQFITENLKWHGHREGKRIQEALFGDKS